MIVLNAERKIRAKRSLFDFRLSRTNFVTKRICGWIAPSTNKILFVGIREENVVNGDKKSSTLNFCELEIRCYTEKHRIYKKSDSISSLDLRFIDRHRWLRRDIVCVYITCKGNTELKVSHESTQPGTRRLIIYGSINRL